MDHGSEPVPAVPPLWLHIGTERRAVAQMRQSQKLSWNIFEGKIHPNYLAWRPRDVRSRDNRMLLLGGGEDALISSPPPPPSRPRRVSGAPIAMAPGGPPQRAPKATPGSVCVMLLPAASVAPGGAASTPREPTSHVALRATTPPFLSALKGAHERKLQSAAES